MKFKLNLVLRRLRRRVGIRYRLSNWGLARGWPAAVVKGKSTAAQSVQIPFLRQCDYPVTFARLDKRLQGPAFFRGVGVIDRMDRIARITTTIGAAAEASSNDDRDQPEKGGRTRDHWLTLPLLAHDL